MPVYMSPSTDFKIIPEHLIDCKRDPFSCRPSRCSARRAAGGEGRWQPSGAWI